MTDKSKLQQCLDTAYAFGRTRIDLSGCYYGAPHWQGPFVDKPLEYYFFLAGLVAQLCCSRILELGTHFGGSIFSMVRGLEAVGLRESAEIVTVDLADSNSEGFRANQTVRRILGDCLSADIVRRVARSFTGPVDLLFIDAAHDYEHTHRCLDTYVPVVSPGLVILDDIHLNASMNRLWTDLSTKYGACAIDITTQSHREPDVGFGLLIRAPARQEDAGGGIR
jgi:cephalosporin hydroxylase